MDQQILSIVTTYAGSQAETKRTFAARAVCSRSGQALEILAHTERGNSPQLGDEVLAYFRRPLLPARAFCFVFGNPLSYLPRQNWQASRLRSQLGRGCLRSDRSSTLCRHDRTGSR